ncbi:hypothetical protein C922_04651 [Plasmodium inui San Antonio 1]|uniref:Uncharacterized protein n=1 Tax=Plasmodium inui San Antonio 1 TaxID=1237626 RepID=W7A726_9APIC|nr:hypothetical protein C922_04651 [Plasmodium inui San Antonio 1]EUD64919.1 hypothetical protein C922_04651 [Plasmodium inui San Antonio 1]
MEKQHIAPDHSGTTKIQQNKNVEFRPDESGAGLIHATGGRNRRVREDSEGQKARGHVPNSTGTSAGITILGVEVEGTNNKTLISRQMKQEQMDWPPIECDQNKYIPKENNSKPKMGRPPENKRDKKEDKSRTKIRSGEIVENTSQGRLSVMVRIRKTQAQITSRIYISRNNQNETDKHPIDKGGQIQGALSLCRSKEEVLRGV